MAIALVQSATDRGDGGTWTVTLGAAPTAGNLLVAMGAVYNSFFSTSQSLSPSGGSWTKVAGFRGWRDGGSCVSCAVHWKVAGAGLSATISGTWADAGGSATRGVTVMEFSPAVGWGAAPNSTPYVFQSEGTGTTSIPLGAVTPVGSPFQPGVAVLLGATHDPTTFTNNASYTEVLDGAGGGVGGGGPNSGQGSFGPAHNHAYKILSAVGTSQSVTLTQGYSDAGRAGLLIVFTDLNSPITARAFTPGPFG